MARRGDKQVTMVRGLETSLEGRKELLKLLKSKIGVGGVLDKVITDPDHWSNFIVYRNANQDFFCVLDSNRAVVSWRSKARTARRSSSCF